MKHTFAALLLVLAAGAFAQAPGPVPPEMQALGFLLGDWEGTARISRGAAGPIEVAQSERVRPLIGGHALLIEGTGRDPADTSRVTFRAAAVVSYDPKARRYAMQTFLPGGRGTRADVEAGPNRLVWRSETGEVRYTIWLDDEGRWRETGEHTRDGGATWHRFIEMSLVKRKPAD